jgi:hypothetical protein
MRRMLLVLCLILGAFLTVSVVAAQDEDGDTLALPVLVDGESVDGEFESSTMQLYYFLGSEGDEVSITMEQDEDSLLDPFVILLGANGEVIAYNDDSSSGDLAPLASEVEDAELPADGAYVVVATALSELREPTIAEGESLDEAQAYVLTVSGFSEPEGADDPEVTNLNGFVVEAEDDGSIAADGVMTITTDAPVQYIFFPATEGQEINVTTSESSDSDTQLTDTMVYVFDAEGARIAGSDDADGLYAATSVEAPDDGIYIVFVTSYLFWTAGEMGEDYTGIGDAVVTLEVE